MVPKNKKMLVVELEMKKERETKKMKTNTMMTWHSEQPTICGAEVWWKRAAAMMVVMTVVKMVKTMEMEKTKRV